MMRFPLFLGIQIIEVDIIVICFGRSLWWEIYGIHDGDWITHTGRMQY